MKNLREPLVTVVITTYKREASIVRRALDSVVDQSYSNLEIYVVNDYPDSVGLTRDIEKLIKEYESQWSIYYIVMKENGGACKARNAALSRAKGKYFACLDDDDEWLPDKIRLQVRKGERDSETAIVYCNSIIKYVDLGTERIRFAKEQIIGNIYDEMFSKNIIGSCSFPLIRTDCLRDVGGFNLEMPALQDWELYLRLLKKYKADYVHEPVAIYYFYEGERISMHPEKRTEAFEKIYMEFQNDIHMNKKYCSDFFLMGTYFYSLAGNMKMAIYYYIKGTKNAPLKIKRNVKELLKMIFRKFVSPKAI